MPTKKTKKSNKRFRIRLKEFEFNNDFTNKPDSMFCRTVMQKLVKGKDWGKNGKGEVPERSHLMRMMDVYKDIMSKEEGKNEKK